MFDDKIGEAVKAALAAHNDWLENVLDSLARCGINLERDVGVEYHPDRTSVVVFGNVIFSLGYQIKNA